ncbi:small G protein signaling modulator 1 isoform X2 [Neoarius graeffei]|uniref:small G protein signaling modulator 1 isoform X2 n=1 Tax=Neoarius graeffei TaxID=443677 RepID=UPI00298D2900|nr:small G protein signaling modulator 1 isoform X2 [Neoarius graeffei]
MGEAETRQRLLRSVKKEVKQIMEEAVTRKFVHEESSHIISFCAVVEACVLHGLKRRAAGFLRSNKLAALFLKVGKIFTPAEDLCKKVQELEQLIENNSRQIQSQTSQDGVRKQSRIPNLSPQAVKHLWIRTALTEKVLDKIVLYLVENSSKFYEREALLRDPVDGPILASLLVGPCALEYTKAKTANHFWTDPSADELVQRHRIHSGYCRQDSPTKRPALIQKRQSSGSMDDRPSLWARDYVESLHQNSRATLLFGKNNVLVQPTDDMEAIPGYLSLHQTAELMTLKWTPNQLMNGNMGEFDYEKSVYWDYAMSIRLEEIVYLHCHQQVDSGGTVVLVSQDGIQRPPFRFPKGGHLLQFLTCLETGLLPHGQLDPPLWSQRGKGKVFPKLRKRSPHSSCESFSDKDEDEATDYVFRIIYPGSQEFVGPELMDQSMTMWQPAPRKSSCSSCSQNGSSEGGIPNGCNHDRAPLKLLCETMKYQIISRAFYGWLAYCRHLSTVRTHLSALVNPTIIEPDIPYNAIGGLSAEVWKTFLQDSSAYEEAELLRLVYYGGVDPTLRKEVWPFLLGHYHFTMTPEERKEVDEQVRACYEQTMSEWLGCEAIVRQREKEQHAAALAKCASGASVDLRQDSTISTDSSQSCSSEKHSNACSQCDSNSSTQVFGSVDEIDPIESEPKPKDEKPQPKIPNGTLPNCTSSPDSGHPSSRNFSVTSGLSDCSPSTEDASTQENGTKIKLPEAPTVTSDRTVDLPTSSSLEDKLKQEPAEERSLALGTGKGNLIKAPTGALAPEDDMNKHQENEKLKNSDAKEVSRTDTIKSMDSQLDLNEKSELTVSETAENTVSKHFEENTKPSDSNEKSKQILQSSEATSEEITKSLEGIRDSQMVVETQENMEFNDYKDKTEKNIALEMQANKETSTMCDSLRTLTKEGSVEDVKTIDRSPPANTEELTKSEMTSAPHMEPSQKEAQPPEPLSETEVTHDPNREPLEKETKSLQPPSDSERTCGSHMEPWEEETKPPQSLSELEMTSTPEMEPLEKEIKLPQPLLESVMNNHPDMEPMEKEMKPSQSLSEFEITSAPSMEFMENKIKLPQPLSQSEMTRDPDMESLEKETKSPQSLSDSERTRGSHMEPWEEETTPPQPLSELEMTSTPEMEPLEKEIKLPQPLSESVMNSPPDMEPTEKEMKPSQSLSEFEMISAPSMESMENEIKLPQPFSQSEMTRDPDMESLEKETKSPQPLSDSERTCGSHMEPWEEEIKPPQPLSDSERTHGSHMGPWEEETRPLQPSSDLERTSCLEMEPLEKETKPPQTLSELEMTSAPDMEPMEKEIKLPQPLSQSEMTNAPDMESLVKETMPPQSHSESEITSAPDIQPSGKKETMPSQPISESEMMSNSHKESLDIETEPPQPLSESQDIALIMNNPSNADKPDMKSIMNRAYDSNRTKALMKQMNEPVLDSCISMVPLSKQSPDSSDDSPSALEMEEIPAALVYMPSEDILANVPVTLGPPLALTMPPEKAAVGMPALKLCMEAGQTTSPEATESALSEEEPEMESLFPKPDSLAVGDHKNDVASPVSSIGTTYSQELLDLYTLNLHRIDKDVQRCDRNYWYFTTANLEKLRNIMCSYVWQHLDIGYVQGMCDLLAPLLVILDDEAMAFSCFTELMKRMNQNFPHGGAMDTHFANMRSLIQILDSELFELMQQNGDYTHFYFCYRWFLLDFKREMVYDDVFSVWETIWAARTISSGHFVLFIALALVELYRDIILENNMDFTDIIKFFNEMAERHDVPQLLVMARDLVHKVQILIENK